MTIFNLVRPVGITTGILTAATTAALLVVSKRETGSAWSAINSITHMVDGDQVEIAERFLPRESITGLGLNAFSMLAWAALFAPALRRVTRPFVIPASAAATAAAYLVDYHIVPEQFTPGFEKRLTKRGIAALYVTLAVALATSVFATRETEEEAPR